jgi:hypothetical protein
MNIGKQSSKQPRRERKPLDQYWRSAEELAEGQEPQSVLGLCVTEVHLLPDPRAYLPKEWSEGLLSSPDVRCAYRLTRKGSRLPCSFSSNTSSYSSHVESKFATFSKNA